MGIMCITTQELSKQMINITLAYLEMDQPKKIVKSIDRLVFNKWLTIFNSQERV